MNSEEILNLIPTRSQLLRDSIRFRQLPFDNTIPKEVLEYCSEEYVNNLLRECYYKIINLFSSSLYKVWLPDCINTRYVFNENYYISGLNMHYGIKTQNGYDNSIWKNNNIEVPFKKVQRLLIRKGYYLKEITNNDVIFFEIGIRDNYGKNTRPRFTVPPSSEIENFDEMEEETRKHNLEFDEFMQAVFKKPRNE